MNSTVKTILIWVLIVVAAIGLYNLVEIRSAKPREVLNLTKFLEKVQGGEVAEVSIDGTELRGRLTDGGRFSTTIPEDYSAVYDMLTRSGVQVIVVPPGPSWLASTGGLSSYILLGGLVLWLAISAMILVVVVDLSRLVKRELARPGGARASST